MSGRQDAVKRTFKRGRASKTDVPVRGGDLNFRSLADASLNCIIVFQGEHIVYVNPAAVQIVGYAKDELLNMKFWEVMHPDFQDMARKYGFNKLKGELAESRIETKVVCKDGRERWVDAFSSLIELNGQPAVLVTAVDITERKQAEEALTGSQQMLQLVMDNIPQAVFWKDRNSVYTGCNKVFAVATGLCTPENIRGKTDYDLPWSREQADFFRECDRRIMENDRPEYHIIEQQRESSGRYAWVETNKVPLHDAKGVVTGILGTYEDITERKRAEVELRESKEEFRLVADFTYDWESWIGPEGNYIYVSPSCERITGHSVDEFYRDPGLMIRLVHPDDRAAYERHENAHLNDAAGSDSIDFRVRTPSGEIRWVSHLCQPVFGRNGEWLGCRTSNRDITERKKAEIALRESEEKFRVLAETSSALIWLYQGDHFVYVNDAVTVLTGYSKDELCHMKFWEIIHPDCRELIKERGLARQRGETVPSKYETRLLTKTGESPWVEVNAGMVEYRGKPAGIATLFDITQRKRTEEAVKLANAYNRSLIEVSLDPLVTIAPDGRITDVNAATEAVTGYPRNNLVGTDFSDYFTEPAKARKGYQQVFEEGSVKDYPLEIRHRSGHVTPVIYNASVYRDEAGEVIGVFAAARDITERRRAEEALRRSETGLKKSQEIAHLGSWELDLVNNRLTWSDEVYRIFGLQPQEFGVTYEAFLEAVHPDDRAAVDIAYSDSIREGRDSYEIEHRVVRKSDGDLRVVYEKCEHFRNSSGCIVRSLGIVQDITERKRAEAELVRINRAYKAVSRCNEAMIHARDEYVLLRDICDIFVEAGGYRMAWIGYAMDDRDKSVRPMAKTGFEEMYVEKAMVTWADTERGRGPTGTAIRTKMPSVVKNVHTDPDFGPWRVEAIRMGYAAVLGLPLIADDKAFGVLTIYSDKPDIFDRDEIVLLQGLADNLAYGITSIRSRIDRDQAEEALKDSKAQAELYLDLMGHDINNMHQIALGYLELARDMHPEAGEGGFLDKPIEVLQRSAQLIKNVRKLQKLHDGLFQTGLVDVRQLLVDVQRELGAVPHKQVTLNENGCERCLVRANELLHDVFANLVSNAIKHTGDSAEIVVDLDVVRDKGVQYCRVMVEDNGPGITDDFKDRIFHRMLRGTTSAKGMGLGLYLVKSLVESYGGRVWVEDRITGDYTNGARFVVMLPAVEQ